MFDETMKEVQRIQQELDRKSEQVASRMHLSGAAARKAVRRAWRKGCVLCLRQGTRDIYYYKKKVYVACPDCYLERKLEVGEERLKRDIARRLVPHAKPPRSKN